jgi:anaphase-promoting complex subunit 10
MAASMQLDSAPPLCDPPLPLDGKREVGASAVWTVTSAKPGHGVEAMRDPAAGTYWQSDGAQPHVVTLAFPRKLEVLELAFLVDFKADESYTPKTLRVLAGNSPAELRELRSLELAEPVGWVHVRLQQPGAAGAPPRSLQTFLLQLVVATNHQNGRDTHIRQMRVFGPRRDQVEARLRGEGEAFREYAVVR